MYHQSSQFRPPEYSEAPTVLFYRSEFSGGQMRIWSFGCGKGAVIFSDLVDECSGYRRGVCVSVFQGDVRNYGLA